jgi:L-aspartate oxidase
MGGVETDLDGRTSLEGLLAAGEVACTGVHGANRLASNSLLEGLAFGARAAQAMCAPPRRADLRGEVIDWPAPHGGHEVPLESEVRGVMWHQVGLLRARHELEAAVARLEGWSSAVSALRVANGPDHDACRVDSLVTVGLLIARAALRREESRGGHFRTDFRRRDDLNWMRHVSDRLPV